MAISTNFTTLYTQQWPKCLRYKLNTVIDYVKFHKSRMWKWHVLSTPQLTHQDCLPTWKIRFRAAGPFTTTPNVPRMRNLTMSPSTCVSHFSIRSHAAMAPTPLEHVASWMTWPRNQLLPGAVGTVERPRLTRLKLMQRGMKMARSRVVTIASSEANTALAGEICVFDKKSWRYSSMVISCNLS